MNNLKYLPTDRTSYSLLALNLLLYSILIGLMTHLQLGVDFSSLYAAIHALQQGHDPYLALQANFLPHAPQLAANLNPPITLLLFQPLAALNYQTALMIWITLSSLLQIVSILFIIQISFPTDAVKQYWLTLLGIGCLFYGVIINTALAQMGAFLLFLMMAGYRCYQRRQDTLAGILWGLLIATKFFPGLLFLLALHDKRFRVFWIMGLTTLSLSALPLIIDGPGIYHDYFNMLPKVLWFGDTWNASLYGFLFRGGINLHFKPVNTHTIQLIYLILLGLTLGAYWCFLDAFARQPHQAFCFTLTLMMLFSPLAWIYYFPLLLLPYAITWRAYSQALPQHYLHFSLWLLSLLLTNLPLDNISPLRMNSLLDKTIIHSLYFFGVLLLGYLCINMPKLKPHQAPPSNRLLAKPASVRELQGDKERKTGAYTSVCEDLSTVSTKQFSAEVGLCKKSNNIHEAGLPVIVIIVFCALRPIINYLLLYLA